MPPLGALLISFVFQSTTPYLPSLNSKTASILPSCTCPTLVMVISVTARLGRTYFFIHVLPDRLKGHGNDPGLRNQMSLKQEFFPVHLPFLLRWLSPFLQYLLNLYLLILQSVQNLFVSYLVANRLKLLSVKLG